MMADIYNWKGEKTGGIEVSDTVFKREWNGDLVHQVLLAFEANQRRPWAHAKGRSEVSGGGKKPWRQKGTGRARHGSIRSPLWKGGGVTHGPVKERDFSQKINKKMTRAAIHCVLSKKLAEGELKFVEPLKLTKVKTKEAAAALKSLLKAKKLIPSALIVGEQKNVEVTRATRNIPKIKTVPAAAINIYDLLTHKNVLVEKEAVSLIK